MAMLLMDWRMVISFGRDVSHVFNIGRNWTNFDVSTPHLVLCASGVRDGVGSDMLVVYVTDL